MRPEELAELPELRTETERPEPSPDRERESRPETDLREVEERDDDRAERDDDRDDRDDDPDPPRTEALPERALSLPRPPPAIPVGGELTMPVGDTTGARPQVPQYSSPPPMSS
ncbi:hypothetical protein [Streptomyces sp. NBC_00455]|uniref:hypothetical protein n=1 Tax=Streptomyces sp. NBC_00455 TaxID=2903654 RepID=UPI003FCD4E97